MELSDMSAAERQVWAAFPAGSWVDFRTGDNVADDPAQGLSWGPERTVRAQVLRALLLGASEPEPGLAPGIRLRGARISGRLDLMGAVARWPLVCEHCHFADEVRLVESQVKTVRIVYSRMAAMNATRMRLDGILNLWHSSVAGVIRLDQAQVTGQLCLAGVQVGIEGGPAEAVSAAGLTVNGGLDCAGLRAHGSVALNVARITGTADFRDASVSSAQGSGLSADYAQIGGRLDCRRAVVDGETSLHNTRVDANVLFSGATLTNPAGHALSAGGLTAGGGVFLGEGCTATGEVRLIGAHIRANLTLSGARLANPGALAVNLDRATIGVCHGSGLACAGTFSMSGANIASDVNLADAELDAGPGQLALVGNGTVLGGALVLAGLRSAGEISLRSAHVGRAMLLTGATLANAGLIALRMSGAEIASDVLCGEMTVTGGIRMTGARIGGRLNLGQVRLHNAGKDALSARSLQAGRLALRPAAVDGLVDLTHARIEILTDDPACWPNELSLDGLTYQALEPRLPAQERLRWLTRDPRGHQSQPYEHLAAHYVRAGQPAQGRAILYAREKAQRRAATPLARTWSVVQDVALGYGYRPGRAVAWLALLLVAGSITFSLDQPPAAQPALAPHFNPVIYTLDLLLPLVDLGQRHAFNPSGATQWLSYALIAAGWILATTVAAAAARVLRRG